MPVLQDRLEHLLLTFNERAEPFSEAEISDALRGLLQENLDGDENSRSSLQAEQMAFGFHASNHDDRRGWATYYGPMLVMKNEQGQWIEAPSIKLVTSETLAYWMRRADSVTHPLLRLRYADLIWDFTHKVTNTRPNIRTAHLVIDATLDLIRTKKYKHGVEAIHKLERTLSIAISIGDKARIEAVKNTMIAFEDEIADDNKPGLWGFSFDDLFLNKKVPMSAEENQKIINDMEARLARFTAGDQENYVLHGVEAAALRLARYYRGINRLEDMHRVLRLYGGAVIDTARLAGAIAGLAHLQNLHQIYYDFGMQDDANSLAGLIHETGTRTSDEMHELSHTITIPTERIEQYMEELTQGTLEDVLKRIAVHFVPDSEKTVEQVRDLAARAPLTFLISHSILDANGRPVATVGSIEDDFDGRVVLQLSQNMQIDAMFLREVIKRTRDKFSPSVDSLLEYLYTSPLFQPSHKNLVTQGLDAYLHDDHVTATHILIPQIENALRYLLETSGGSVYKPNRFGGLALRILDEILRDDKVVNVLSENVTKYIRVLLVDQRGWNIRNDVFHGMMHPDRFNIAITDRIFHVLLLLALIREKDSEKK